MDLAGLYPPAFCIMTSSPASTGLFLRASRWGIGSERFVCVLCKHVTFADSDGRARSRKLRALAVTSGQRTPECPDVPTLAEAGAPSRSPFVPAISAVERAGLKSLMTGRDPTAWLAWEDSKCAGRPARSRWCKSTTMKE